MEGAKSKVVHYEAIISFLLRVYDAMAVEMAADTIGS